MIDILIEYYLKVKLDKALSEKYGIVQLVCIWDKWSFPIPAIQDTCFDI
jgi:hypothetical protein